MSDTGQYRPPGLGIGIMIVFSALGRQPSLKFMLYKLRSGPLSACQTGYNAIRHSVLPYVTFSWFPSHVDLEYNERVEQVPEKGTTRDD